jgi:signal transduction histidine kinase
MGENAEFRAFAEFLPRLASLIETLRGLPQNEPEIPVDAWIARLVVRWAEGWRLQPDPIMRRRGLEELALREFALGPLPRKQAVWLDEVGWLPPDTRDWFDADAQRFRNALLRDYFLACKVAREVEAGNSEILLRYQFPPFVFLFLTHIAPEIAARLTQGSVERLEAKVQAEVERKLYLTFAHHLGRPVGMMRTHLDEIREAIGKEKATALKRQFQALEAEIEHINQLAEKTRLWGANPDESLTGLQLSSIIDEVAGPLRARYPAAILTVDVEPSLLVQGMRNALRETLQCLLENAFHASLALPQTADRKPQVTVAARLIGDVVRLEARDNGPGVPVEDRDRIFEPLVTTKKGGRDKPRGTGLGLAIARRYAQHMGGRVGLDATQPETCFFLDLVHWKETGHG